MKNCEWLVSRLGAAVMGATLAVAVGSVVAPATASAEQVDYWPQDEDDERLKELDNRVIRLQKARFQAVFAEDRDEQEIVRIREEFNRAQKARSDLLRKTGRY